MEPSIRNPNYRGQQQSQLRNKKKEHKNKDPQGQIRTPFQQNYTQGLKEDEEEIAEANHFFEEDELPNFLTEEDQFSQELLHQVINDLSLKMMIHGQCRLKSTKGDIIMLSAICRNNTI